MIRRLCIAVALGVAIVAGIAAASVVSPGIATEQPPAGRDELPAGAVENGAAAADPNHGPPWSVRVYDRASSRRCINVGRTDGTSFGPVDSAGEVRDRGDVASGSCADPAEQPSQVAVARYADSGGSGPRSVLFGLVDDTVVRVNVDAPGLDRPVTPDSGGTFIVVSEGLWDPGTATVTFTLSNGATRSYHL
jgi:hypothetical protein